MALQRSSPNGGPHGFQSRSGADALHKVPVRTVKFRDFVAVVDSGGFFHKLSEFQPFWARRAPLLLVRANKMEDPRTKFSLIQELEVMKSIFFI